MKKFKDLLYDYNDILLAILIIIIAAGIIFFKVADIMAYPSFAKAEQEQNVDVDISNINLEKTNVDPVVNPGTDEIEGQENNQEDNSENNQGETTPTQDPTPVAKDVEFTVPAGAASKTAEALENLGLCKADEFIKYLSDNGLETKIQAGTFTIPAGSSVEQIAKILCRIKN